MTFQTSASDLQVVFAVFGSPTSDFMFRISNLRVEISGFKPHLSYLGLQTSDFGFGVRNFGIRHWASDFRTVDLKKNEWNL